ncbi:hypothetical protein [Vitreimonas sp.]|uniref:hypothetical protein n=1 Tax=Vitreimonas sp. TaxID=3069702 RepID=UPI002EDB0297
MDSGEGALRRAGALPGDAADRGQKLRSAHPGAARLNRERHRNHGGNAGGDHSETHLILQKWQRSAQSPVLAVEMQPIMVSDASLPRFQADIEIR